MTFSSLSFLFLFFPVTFIMYALCKGSKARNAVLAAASLVFYAFGEPAAVIILIISVLCNYLFGFMVAGRDARQNKLFAGIAAAINIGLLVCYKYAGFFISLIQGADEYTADEPGLRIPIGISFFTLQGLGYVIDVYRDKRKLQKKLLSVFLYISFFPQLIAGPLVRYQDIENQLRVREFSSGRVSRGIRRFAFGLGKKVLIANQLGIVADRVFAYDTDSLGTVPAWAGALCFTLQIFFDFSGYSDMAIGLGCIFGFDYKENFNYPYTATSIKDFWKRWHISLSSWFKEYLYIPLGGNRKGAFRADLNRFIVFLAAGLWHGANYTFIVLGILYGVITFLENHDIIPVRKKGFRPFGHVYVLLVTVAAFVIFRADTMSQALGILGKMITISGGDSAVRGEISSLITPLFVITFCLAVVLSMPVFRMAEEKAEKSAHARVFTVTEYVLSLVIYLLCVLALISGSSSQFIYFRF